LKNKNLPYSIQPNDYISSIKNEDDFYIQFKNYLPEVEELIYKIIHKYLEKYDLLYIKNPILTVTKELINNAVKANIKRIYFKIKKLDINKINDYREGMESFKEDAFLNINKKIIEHLNKSNLVVRLSFKTSENFVHINIINNIPILEAEEKKINARIKKAYNYKDISDAFVDVLDDSEGAGLGLIMAMMLYKNTGLDIKSIRVYKKDNLTISTMTLPKFLSKPDSTEKIAEEILKEINEIPAFPENIKRIQILCSTPETPMNDIADSISKDPGLTSSIIKLANSAGYITISKTESIHEAVKIIGIKGINTLVMASGVYKIIESRYKKHESIWQESYERAFYAQKISIQMKNTKISDFSYIAGLLSDIGLIMMLSIKPKLLKKLKLINGSKGLDDSELIEEISLGLSHSSLGAMIAEKWKFEDALVKAIKYHNRPHMAPESLKKLIYTVYLADVFIEIEKSKTRFELIDSDVLDFFKLEDKKDFEKLHAILKESYLDHKN